MGKLVEGDGSVNVNPCTIAELNEYGGWSKLDLPEPLRVPPRPDTPLGGSRGEDD